MRIVVQESAGSADEEVASVGEGGSYDELVQTIDHVVHESGAPETDPA